MQMGFLCLLSEHGQCLNLSDSQNMSSAARCGINSLKVVIPAHKYK